MKPRTLKSLIGERLPIELTTELVSVAAIWLYPTKPVVTYYYPAELVIGIFLSKALVALNENYEKKGNSKFGLLMSLLFFRAIHMALGSLIENDFLVSYWYIAFMMLDATYLYIAMMSIS